MRVAIRKFFPKISDDAVEPLIQRIEEFKKSGLADSHFESDLRHGGVEKFWQRIFEVNLAFYFWDQGKQLQSKDNGPDFVVPNDIPIYVEAVAPTFPDMPDDFRSLDQDDGIVHVATFPKEQIILRITSAIRNKYIKFEEYRKKGLIENESICVIAIGLTNLGTTTNYMDHHCVLLSSVYPIGNLCVPFGDKHTDEECYYPYRPYIIKRKQDGTEEQIATDTFTNTTYSTIGAIIGCGSSIDGLKNISVIHNRMTERPLPIGFFSAANEFPP